MSGVLRCVSRLALGLCLVMATTGPLEARTHSVRSPGADTAVGSPARPPARVCDDTALLSGPATAPDGAIVVPAGDNSGVDFGVAGATYWFAPGTHTLGEDPFGQIIPGDGSTFIGGPGAVLDGQRLNRYAFTQHATGVTIRYLTIRNFGQKAGNIDEGVVNHDGGDGWTIQYNTVRDNAGAGVFLGSHNLLESNCITGNGQYGFSMYKPPVPHGSAIVDVRLAHNEISYNNADDIETVTGGCGCTGGGKFWDVRHAVISGNWVHHNRSVGLWADTNDIDFVFKGNYISNNDSEGIFFEISYNALIQNNTFVRNAHVKGRGMAKGTFPVGAIYISESGGDPRVSPNHATLEIVGNQFRDNWSGVVLWENADRFCNSPANTSGGYCTKGGAATLKACKAGKIDEQPLYSDCRWKTRNVHVHGNDFSHDPTAIRGCAGSLSCGQQGIFSNYGTYPDWSPYKGEVIERAITFEQDNRFFDNHYVGPWGFTAFDQSRKLTRAEWQAAPYGQDAGSTFD